MKSIIKSSALFLALLSPMSVMTAQADDSDITDTAWILPEAPADATTFDFKLKGYVLGLRMIKADYEGFVTDDTYVTRSRLRTSGLGALLKKLQIWAITDGHRTGGDFRPLSHTQQNEDKKNRRVEMRYDTNTELVAVDIQPPLGSQGLPPASPEERFNADDTISAILNIMLRGTPDTAEICTGRVKVFDSKQHYALRMERVEEKDKDGRLACYAYYEPISGFDPEDLPESEEAEQPVKIYFTDTPIHGLYIPYKFTYDVGMFKAVIKVSDYTITQGESSFSSE